MFSCSLYGTFDSILHFVLSQKIFDIFPIPFWRILVSECREHTVQIKWGRCISGSNSHKRNGADCHIHFLLICYVTTLLTFVSKHSKELVLTEPHLM